MITVAQVDLFTDLHGRTQTKAGNRYLYVTPDPLNINAISQLPIHETKLNRFLPSTGSRLHDRAELPCLF